MASIPTPTNDLIKALKGANNSNLGRYIKSGKMNASNNVPDNRELQ